MTHVIVAAKQFLGTNNWEVQIYGLQAWLDTGAQALSPEHSLCPLCFPEYELQALQALPHPAPCKPHSLSHQQNPQHRVCHMPIPENTCGPGNGRGSLARPVPRQGDRGRALQSPTPRERMTGLGIPQGQLGVST